MARGQASWAEFTCGRSWRGWAALFVLALLILGGCRSQAQDLPVPWPTPSALAVGPADPGPILPAPSATPTVMASATPVPLPTATPTVTPTSTPQDPNPFRRTTNILLLGSDRRPRDVNWRTDVIMIVALDFQKGEVGVISLPRDLYLEEILGHQPNKINVVDYLGEQNEPGGGGPALLGAILEERLEIPIHAYLRFEFEGFKRVINALGGVEIQVDCPVYDYIADEDVVINLGVGVHRLTGAQALSFVRTRRQGGDLERARRQQRMALAIRDQMLSKDLLPRVPALYVALQDAVATDIGLVDAIRFTRFALQLTETSLHGMILGPSDTMQSGWRRGMFVFVPDWPAMIQAAQSVFDRPPLIETNTVGPGGDVAVCR